MGRVKVILDGDNRLLLQPEETGPIGEGLLFRSRRCLVALPVILNADGSRRPADAGAAQLKRLSSAGTIRSVSYRITELHEGDTAAARLEDHTGDLLTMKHRVAPLAPELSLDRAAFVGILAWLMNAVRHARIELGTRVAVVGMGTEGHLLARLCDQSGAQTIALDSCRERLSASAAVRSEYLPGARQRGINALFSGGSGADTVFVAGSVASSELWNDIFNLLRPGGRIIILNEQTTLWHTDQLPAHPLSVDFFLDDRMWDDWHPAARLALPHGYLRWTTANNLAACAMMLALKQFDITGVPLCAFDADIDRPAAFSVQDAALAAAILLRFAETGP